MGSRFKKRERAQLGFSEEEKARFSASENPPQTTQAPQSPVQQDPIAHRHFEVELHGKDAPSPFEEQQRARFRLDARSRRVLYLAATLVAVFLLTLLLPNNIFNVNNTQLSPAWFLHVTGRNLQNLATLVTGGGAYGSIDFTINRLIIVGLVGAGLATAGTAYQGVLKNQLASPSTLGVMSGARFGCVLYIWIAPTTTLLGAAAGNGQTLSATNEALFDGSNLLEAMVAQSQMALFSLAGSLVVVCIVMAVSSLVAKRRNPRVAMVITGQVIAGCISSFVVIARMWFIAYGDSYQVDAMTTIMLGSFDNAFTLTHLVMIGVPVALCLALVMALRRKLNLLAFDEEEARSMGVRVGALRTLLVVCCTLLTAIIVAFCGAIGYVGFLSAHLARRLVGPDFRFLLPAAALFGASFLLLAYYCVSNFSVPGGSISMATTAIGVVLFVIVIFQQRRAGNASW